MKKELPKNQINCFKTYDIRGLIGSEINNNIVRKIGRAVAQYFSAQKIVVGFDSRETSKDFARSLSDGICQMGANVLDIGLAGTEEMYWAVTEFGADAGIEITASHNPIDYNGMKIVKASSLPLLESEFLDIRKLAENNDFVSASNYGLIYKKGIEARSKYIKKILSFIDEDSLSPMKIAINFGNGTAGPTFNALVSALKKKKVETNFVELFKRPDSSFPNGIPNPLIKKNQKVTADLVRAENADFGVAFDGDFDRCFFFDEKGQFIPGEYIVGLLAGIFLAREPGASIIYDPRVIWNTLDIVEKSGGRAVVSKTGHTFLKYSMQRERAIYGGEMSAHHYFKDFAYCDSGMLPWLLVWEFLSREKCKLSDFIAERREIFISSGEINFTIENPSFSLDQVCEFYAAEVFEIDKTDGLSLSFENWRFNLRKSNTEPLVRLNVEAKDSFELLKRETDRLTEYLKSF